MEFQLDVVKLRRFVHPVVTEVFTALTEAVVALLMLFQLVFSAVWMELQLDVVNVRRLVQPLVTTVLTALTAVVLADLIEFQLAVRLDWMPDQLDARASTPPVYVLSASLNSV